MDTSIYDVLLILSLATLWVFACRRRAWGSRIALVLIIWYFAVQDPGGIGADLERNGQGDRYIMSLLAGVLLATFAVSAVRVIGEVTRLISSRVRGLPGPGYYADPTGEGLYRCWDGASWTPLVMIDRLEHDTEADRSSARRTARFRVVNLTFLSVGLLAYALAGQLGMIISILAWFIIAVVSDRKITSEPESTATVEAEESESRTSRRLASE